MKAGLVGDADYAVKAFQKTAASLLLAGVDPKAVTLGAMKAAWDSIYQTIDDAGGDVVTVNETYRICSNMFAGAMVSESKK